MMQPNFPALKYLLMTAPLLIILLTAVVLLVLEVIWKASRRRGSLAMELSADISTFGTLIAALSVPWVWGQMGGQEQPAAIQLFVSQGGVLGHGASFPNWAGAGLVVDHFGLFVCLLACMVVIVARLALVPYFNKRGLYRPEVFPLLLFAASGMMLLGLSRDLLVTFIAIEILSLPLYVMCGLDQDHPSSRESSLKYFLLGAFASGFLVYGMALIYGACGNLNYAAIAYYVSSSTEIGTIFLAGLALIGVGFFFKLALVPFHAWLPDVYQGAPTPITAFMAAGVKLGVFAALLRFSAETLSQLDPGYWRTGLLVFAGLSMLIGNLFALHQMSAKRLLAYSAITHSGYIALGVAAGGMAAQGVLIYLTGYYLAAMGAFAVISYLAPKGQDDLYLDEMHGLAQQAPWSALSLAILLLSMAGFPLTIGFIGKFVVFAQAWKAGLYGMVIFAVLNSVIGVYYYLRFVLAMYMLPRAPGAEPLMLERAPQAYVLSNVLTVGLTLLLGVLPGVLTAVLQTCRVGWW